MGTLVDEIVSDAYREPNITAIGDAPTPNQYAEGLTRLNRLIRGSLGWFIGEKLQDWRAPAPQRTAPVAANYPQLPYPSGQDPYIMPFPLASEADNYVYPYPPSNSRVIWGGDTLTVYFPEQPANGARMALVQGSGAGDDGLTGNVLTFDGNGRYIGVEGQTQETFVFSTSAPLPAMQWIYIADTGTWTPLVDLALGAAMVFPERFDDFWVTSLAVRIAPRYNKTISAESKLALQEAEGQIVAAFRQPGTTVYGSQDFPRSYQSFVSGRWFW